MVIFHPFQQFNLDHLLFLLLQRGYFCRIWDNEGVGLGLLFIGKIKYDLEIKPHEWS